jgi:hypothetical protein
MEQAIRNAAFFGLTIEMPPEAQQDGLWPEHETAWRAWCQVSSQWSTITLSGHWGAKVIWLGLDYSRAKDGLAMAAMTLTADEWQELRLIEEGAKEELNKRG